MNTRDDIIYLDHAAATPLRPEALADMAPYWSQEFYNPSAPYAPAVAVRAAYEHARADLAHAVGGKPAEVIVTAGATESINLAFAAFPDAHVVTTAIEHAAVLESARATRRPASCPHEAVDGEAAAGKAATEGVSGDQGPARAADFANDLVTLVPVDRTGRVSPEDVAAAIRPDTRLVSVGLANNEIGTVQPLRAIAAAVREERARRLAAGDATPIFLHTDASQGAGQVDVNVATLGVDLLTCNAAKVGGPKQVGMLWASPEVRLRPLVAGGGQERGLRSGTENVPGAVGFACALTLAVAERKAEAARLAALRDTLEGELLAAFPNAQVSGHKRHRLPGFCHMSFPGIDAERVVFLLEDKGVLVGTGAACAANKDTASHVLAAIGLPPELAQGSLRLSLGRLSTPENTVRAVELIIAAVRSEYERMAR